MESFTKRKLAILDRLRTPERIHEYLGGLTYNLAPDGKAPYVALPARAARATHGLRRRQPLHTD